MDNPSTYELKKVASTPSPQPALVSVPPGPKRRGAAFWLIFVAICVSLFQAAFEASAVATALPTIARALKSDDFVWVGSSYALSSTASLPMMGGLAQAFGRRPVMLGSIFVFAFGSTICGAAANMNMLIAGRTIQGFGGGGILSLSSIIVSDLVSLRERGAFNGLLGLTWSAAIASAAVSGGSLAEHGQWRWIFYLNLPVSAVAFALVFAFLKLKTPTTSLREKLAQMDWIGNFIVIASSTSICIALAWAGIRFSWGSAEILVPLILGLVGLLCFFFYEAKYAAHPVVPFSLLNNRTCVSGYVATFVTPFIVLAATYYFPVYLQACKGDTPVQSGGVDWIGVALTVGPFGIIAGIAVAATHKYRPSVWVGWVFLVIGMGLWTTLGKDSTRGKIVGYEIIAGIGAGILFTVTYFPVLSPLPVSYNARALAFFAFVRAFAQIWGITIGATVLQNGLLNRLPEQFVKDLPKGTQVAYSVIPLIKNLDDAVLKDEVREAFAGTLRVLWRVLAGVTGFGALTTLMMKEIPLHSYTDDDWALQDGEVVRATTVVPQIEPRQV